MASKKRPASTVRITRKSRSNQASRARTHQKKHTPETASNELENFLASSDVAIMCLDRQLRLRWLSPGIRTLFKIRLSDIGRSINDLSTTVIGEGLSRDARTVLIKQLPLAREIELPNRRWYLRRILPYRDERNQNIGIIVKCIDISEIKRQAQELITSQKILAETLEQHVQERTQQLRALSMELALAEEHERRALARDLHDDLGQLLAVAKIKITTLAKLEKTADLKHRVDDIQQILDQAHSAVHSLTFQLSPPVLHELGLIPALEWLGEEMHRLYGLDVKIHDDHKPKPLDLPVRTILFRAVRELLINVAKHAKVTQSLVTIKRTGSKISIVVADEGVGFHMSRYQKVLNGKVGGFGLLNVRERLSYIGGEVLADSIPGDGTRITLLAPLAPKTRVKEKQQ